MLQCYHYSIVNFARFLINLIPTETAFAHCDIPCKIYDPYGAQVAAHSVIRMTQMLLEADKDEDSVARESQVARLTKVKEEHAELVKHEIRVIWGDYFKEDQIKQVPNVHELVHKIMMKASKARQEINLDAAKELLTLVQDFSEAFYKTKGFETMRVPSGFPTEGELVVHK